MRNVVAAVVLGVIAAGAVHAGESGETILDETSPFRCHYTWRTPVVGSGSDLRAFPGRGNTLLCHTPMPPNTWREPDFDDGSWSRWPGPAIEAVQARERARGAVKYNHGVGSYPWEPFQDTVSPCLALLCMRGRFRVTDPRDMRLSVTHRGGVAVYVNGKEIARAHLPRGEVGLDALAEGYPQEAHLGTNGKPFAFYRSAWRRVGGDERMPLRLRRLKDVIVPSSVLRKGINVLALEIHRAPHHRRAVNWGTCGPVKVDLRAAGGAEPNVSRPSGVQVWNCNWKTIITPLDYGDPAEPLRPIEIVGARNGIFTGRIVVSSDGSLRGVKAVMSDLAPAEGSSGIPASAARILYAGLHDEKGRESRGKRFDPLADRPPREITPLKSPRGEFRGGAVQPIWIKLRIPAEARPGTYRGRLTLSVGGGRSVEVPVHLQVIDWKLPDPRQFETHMALVQSPESVALQYKVPLWSQRHWQLLEKSFELLGEVGNRYVCIPLICRTNFGNAESMVRWIKGQGPGVRGQGAGERDPNATPDTRHPTPDPYTHDFSVFDRYLDLARKHLRLDVVCLYGWDLYCGRLSWGSTRVAGATGPKVSLLDPGSGKV